MNPALFVHLVLSAAPGGPYNLPLPPALHSPAGQSVHNVQMLKLGIGRDADRKSGSVLTPRTVSRHCRDLTDG